MTAAISGNGTKVKSFKYRSTASSGVRTKNCDEYEPLSQETELSTHLVKLKGGRHVFVEPDSIAS